MLCKLCLYLGIYYRVYSRHLFRIIKENATSIGFKCTGHQKVGLWWNWMNYVRVLAQKPDFVFNKNPITVPLKKWHYIIIQISKFQTQSQQQLLKWDEYNIDAPNNFFFHMHFVVWLANQRSSCILHIRINIYKKTCYLCPTKFCLLQEIVTWIDFRLFYFHVLLILSYVPIIKDEWLPPSWNSLFLSWDQ